MTRIQRTLSAGRRARRAGAASRVAATFAALLALLALMACPAEATGQVPWAAPLLASPHAPDGVALLVVAHRQTRDDPLGGALAWRAGDFGARGGVSTGATGATEAFGGIELRAALGPPDGAVAVAWSSGAGLAGSGDDYRLGVPLGVAAGAAWEGEYLWLAPFVGARAILEHRWGDQAPEDATGLALVMDLGADVAFGRRRAFALHLGATLGDQAALVAGVSLRTGLAPNAVTAAR